MVGRHLAEDGRAGASEAADRRHLDTPTSARLYCRIVSATVPESAEVPASASARRMFLALAAVSFVALFAELAFIRWLAAETRIFSFYKNLALISCFLGLGAGATLGRRGSWRRWSVAAVAAFALFVMLAGPRLVGLSPEGGDEFIWVPRATTALDTVRFYVAFVLLFTLNTGVFYAVGQTVGAAFEGLPPLRAYTANLVGSIGGVSAFTAVSYWHLGPLWWFAILLGAGLALTWGDRPARSATIALSAITLVFLGLFADAAIWSPYYKLTVKPHTYPGGIRWGVRISTNWLYHLRAIDLSDAFVQAHPAVQDSPAYGHYSLPYRFVRPRTVLVLGAGGGNDVAAALRNGAEEVTAVEIDPVIADLGRRWHPEKPYESARVTLVVDDARAFLKRASGPYDLIVFGLLDSHTVVSAMSNVRLDSFMYTRECFERVRELLAPTGLVALSFSSGFGESWWVLRRIAAMLERSFASKPVILDVGYDSGFVYLAGPGAPSKLENPSDARRAESARRNFALAPDDTVVEATDDWPFLYLRGRWIPAEYWIVGAAILIVASLIVLRRVPGGVRAIDGQFFFLGAGFLLLEVRNLAEMALLFGSTWIVNAFVIGGVLVMALAANLVASRWEVDARMAFGALGVAVATSFFSPLTYLAGLATWIKVVGGAGILSLPFFFSGLVFAGAFKRAPQPQVAYGSNLLGALFGGLLELASLSYGLRSLSLFALVLYGVAYLARLRSAPAAPVAAAPA